MNRGRPVMFSLSVRHMLNLCSPVHMFIIKPPLAGGQDLGEGQARCQFQLSYLNGWLWGGPRDRKKISCQQLNEQLLNHDYRKNSSLKLTKPFLSILYLCSVVSLNVFFQCIWFLCLWSSLISTFCSVCPFRGLSFLTCLYIFTAVMPNSISLLSVMKQSDGQLKKKVHFF